MPLSVSVSVRGDVSEAEAGYAREKVLRVGAAAPRPILRARVALIREGDPALQRPCVAKAGVDPSGRTVRAHVAAHTMNEAADLLEERLRRRHGDLRAARPEFCSRPVVERRLVRRTSFVLEPQTPDEDPGGGGPGAALLGHDGVVAPADDA